MPIKKDKWLFLENHKLLTFVLICFIVPYFVLALIAIIEQYIEDHKIDSGM